jgi:hypothetical protein
MEKHMTSIPRTVSREDEWLIEPVEQLTGRKEADTYRLESEDRGAFLTDLQRAALRWLSSFD